MDKTKKDLLVFGYGLGIIALIFCIGGTMRHGWDLPQMVQAVCAIIFIGVTFVNWEALKPGYRGWMRVAHMIGTVVSTVILGLVFYAVFAPVGILLRILRKDHLDRRIDRAAASYWHQRPVTPIDRDRYTKQF
ncbi:MAG: hypothetical protein GX606_06265 [Elusimicrobia bacterium]|nr:hypothetical protein [Elusimicrobiota bacterium]